MIPELIWRFSIQLLKHDINSHLLSSLCSVRELHKRHSSASVSYQTHRLVRQKDQLCLELSDQRDADLAWDYRNSVVSKTYC